MIEKPTSMHDIFYENISVAETNKGYQFRIHNQSAKRIPNNASKDDLLELLAYMKLCGDYVSFIKKENFIPKATVVYDGKPEVLETQNWVWVKITEREFLTYLNEK